MSGKSVISVAVGSPYFYELAKNLIASFLHWNKHNEITFILLTDQHNFFSNLIHPKVTIKQIELSQIDKSFTSKFHLFENADSENQLFVDCDCLIYKDLSPVFEELKEFNFTAIGTLQRKGHFFCDIPSVLNTWSVNELPVFVGSVYFFKKNPIAHAIFEKALELKTQYDEFGFVRLRGKENEEPLFALSMALYGEKVYSGNLVIKCDAMFYRSIRSNVLKGTCNLNGVEADYAGIYKNSSTDETFIIHFNADYADSWIYKMEAYRLKHQDRYSFWKRLYATTFIEGAGKAKILFKQFFRPLFHWVFGFRKIKETKRVKHLQND